MKRSLMFFLMFLYFFSFSFTSFSQIGWGFGQNDFGQIGNGSTAQKVNTPVSILNLSDIKQVSAGSYHSCALKIDGTVWCWGKNSAGQLGIGNLDPSSSVPVNTLIVDNILQISSGGFFNIALRNDDTVWFWGSYGEDALITNLPIEFINSGMGITKITAGGQHSLFIKSDGTVFAVGKNSFGQLGLGTNTPEDNGTVINLTGVVDIAAGWSHSLALKNDGTVWAWGRNNYGQLGTGNTNDSNIPVKVNNLSGIVKIACGGFHSLALKNDGTIWAWGSNQMGQVGAGYINDQITSPTKVVNSNFVKEIAAGPGSYHSAATTEDGTLWSWGSNVSGQLGNGDNNYKNSATPQKVANQNIFVEGFGIGSYHTIEFGFHLLSISPETLPMATVGTAFSQNLTLTGAVAPTSFTVSSGSLPAGISLNSSGLLSGTPIIPGVYNFTVTATDSDNGKGKRDYVLIVTNSGCSSIGISPANLPSGFQGESYKQTLSASGGTSPYQFSISQGSLPNGLTLSSAGEISGTPTQSAISTFTVTVTDANPCYGGMQYTLTINPPCPTIYISSTLLPDGKVGEPYFETLTSNGGAFPYTYTVSSGSLPPGITLTAIGELTGTPTAGGQYNFTVQLTDANGCKGSSECSIFIIEPCPDLLFNPSTLPNGTVNMPYTKTLTVQGGTAPYTFKIESGSFPTGLTLSSDGIISGTPIVYGTYYILLSVRDSKGCFSSQTFSITIDCPIMTFLPETLQRGYSGVPYIETISISGSAPPYTFYVSGDLPQGLDLASNGILSGTPIKSGVYNFSVLVYDKWGCLSEKNYSLEVIDKPIIYNVFTATNPLRLIVKGAAFKNSINDPPTILINGQPAPITKYKNAVKIIARGGEALKSLLPKGGVVEIRVKNPDGTISDPYYYTP
ncbi:MAG: putative Ig domain-containing protein [Acidobacteriota bacterium]